MNLFIGIAFVSILVVAFVVTLPLSKNSVKKWQQEHIGSGLGDVFDTVWQPTAAEARKIADMEMQLPAPAPDSDKPYWVEGENKIIITTR